MSYLPYIVFGVLPSLIWLLYYLKKDVEPEPKKMILTVFLWGMLVAFPAVLLEMGANLLLMPEKFSISILNIFPPLFVKTVYLFLAADFLILNVFPPLIVKIFYWFLGVALIEEFLKYLVVRDKVLKNPEFNEPVDAMIYMIVAALGFAASENILVFLSQKLLMLPLEKTVTLLVFRFLSATFLHALASALIGYFLALRFFAKKKKFALVGLGLGISVFLHGLYNFSIMELEGFLQIALPVIIIMLLALIVSMAFGKVKKFTK